MKKVWIIILVCIFCLQSMGYGFSNRELLLKARHAAEEGNSDFAFMHYRSLLKNRINDKYLPEILFAHGEYYFLNNQFDLAQQHFQDFVTANSNDSKDQIFALAYLFKLAVKNKNDDLTKSIKKDLMTLKNNTYIFRKNKEYKYQSPLHRAHSAVYSIDNIEVYIEGELFAQISY